MFVNKTLPPTLVCFFWKFPKQSQVSSVPKKYSKPYTLPSATNLVCPKCCPRAHLHGEVSYALLSASELKFRVKGVRAGFRGLRVHLRALMV